MNREGYTIDRQNYSIGKYFDALWAAMAARNVIENLEGENDPLWKAMDAAVKSLEKGFEPIFELVPEGMKLGEHNVYFIDGEGEVRVWIEYDKLTAQGDRTIVCYLATLDDLDVYVRGMQAGGPRVGAPNTEPVKGRFWYGAYLDEVLAGTGPVQSDGTYYTSFTSKRGIQYVIVCGWDDVFTVFHPYWPYCLGWGAGDSAFVLTDEDDDESEGDVKFVNAGAEKMLEAIEEWFAEHPQF